ncbi:MAG: ComF family protein [Lentisphaerae bacterium]|nr:ComF family protein [Lentisphaerota bacterium]MCP4100949.1 ComF family protein [Lentisphaerota bacterium]
MSYTGNMMNIIGKKLLDQIGPGILKTAQFFCSFPCPFCGVKTDGINNFCLDCLKKLRLVKGTRCPGCGGALDGVLELCTKCIEFEQRPWEGAFAIFELRGLGQQVIHRFKFHNSPELARPLAILSKDILSSSNVKFDYIVPVPLHWSRCFWRGYNQSVLFCEELGRFSDIPCSRMLRRVKRTRQQAKLNRDERRKNLLNAFDINLKAAVQGKTILLIDDVMTTGATLSAAANVLKEKCSAQVYILVIGRR